MVSGRILECSTLTRKESKKHLEKILGQEKMNSWLGKQNTIADALAHIETDFQNYQAFMMPVTTNTPTVSSECLLKITVSQA